VQILIAIAWLSRQVEVADAGLLGRLVQILGTPLRQRDADVLPLLESLRDLRHRTHHGDPAVEQQLGPAALRRCRRGSDDHQQSQCSAHSAQLAAAAGSESTEEVVVHLFLQTLIADERERTVRRCEKAR